MIISVGGYKTWLNYSFSDRDNVYIQLVNEVDAAIKRKLNQPLEQATYTEYYDAPNTDVLPLNWLPVYPGVNYAQLTVTVVPGSFGNPASFTNTTPLVPYGDYILEVDQPDGSSRSGILRRINGYWGYSWQASPGRLASRLDPDRRAVQVIYTAGYNPIPHDLQEGAHLAVSKLYLRRQMGAQATSASLNGASYSLGGAATADAVLDDPEVWDKIKRYGDIVGVGSR